MIKITDHDLIWAARDYIKKLPRDRPAPQRVYVLIDNFSPNAPEIGHVDETEPDTAEIDFTVRGSPTVRRFKSGLM